MSHSATAAHHISASVVVSARMWSYNMEFFVTVYCRHAGCSVLMATSGKFSVMAARAAQQTAVAPLGLLVRENRERLHLTQQELATRIGVSRSAISELEAGRIEQPRATVFARLGKALGLPAAALLAAAGYPESEVILDIEADEIALLAASLAQLAGNERDWLRARLVELRELLVLRRSHRGSSSDARTRGAGRDRRARRR